MHRLAHEFQIVAEPCSHPPILLKLPLEILMQVFAHSDPIDRILLALSCKSLLGISKLCKLQVPDRRAHLAPWAAQSAISGNRCRCPTMEQLLKRFRPRDSHGKHIRSLNLCVDCMRYRPTRKAYWTAVLAKTDTEGWDRTQDDMWHTAVKWFGNGVKVQCPSCRLAEWKLEEAPQLRPVG